jgi:hypothetical protein
MYSTCIEAAPGGYDSALAHEKSCEARPRPNLQILKFLNAVELVDLIVRDPQLAQSVRHVV